MGRKKAEFLFPRNLNFSKACSCQECCAKISALKAFQKELMSKLNLVQGCDGQFYYSESRCCRLLDIFESTIICYDVLQDNLNNVYKKIGVPLEEGLHDCDWFSRLKDAYMSVYKLLFGDENNIFQRVDDDDEPCVEEEEGIRALEIGHLVRQKQLYGRSRVKDEADEVINMILDIENQLHGHDDHDNNKKSAIDDDPSVSKKYIEKQIELLKELPFEEVEREMKEIVGKISPYHENLDLLRVVREGILFTQRHMFQTSSEYWQKYPKLFCNDKGHALSGLEITLDSLTNQMNLFNDMWKKDYAPSIAHIIAVCKEAEAQGFCPQGLCPPFCSDH